MENAVTNDKDFVKSANDAFLLMLRLDPCKWICTDVSVDLGTVPLFSDSDPDAATVDTSTDGIRSIDRGNVCVYVSMKSGLRHTCPSCGRLTSVKCWVEHRFKTTPFSGMATEVSVRVPQLHCKECGIYRTARCPLVVPNHGYTKLLKLDVLSFLSEETVSAASRGCGIGRGAVFDILEDAVAKGLEGQDLSDVDTLFIDEIQSTHGQNYITMVADQDHRAIAGVEGHDIGSVEAVRDWLESKGGDPASIRYVSADMSVAYRSGVSRCFPNAEMILDRFHLVKMANEALDKTRKRTNKGLKDAGKEYPKNVKYTVLHRESDLTETHRKRMEEIKVLNPELALAFDLKEEFAGLFGCVDRDSARTAFLLWYTRAQVSGVPEMADLSERMMKRLDDILRWFDHRISNGVAEGLNNIYKKIKSAAFGYKKIGNFIDMCLFRKGRLKISI